MLEGFEKFWKREYFVLDKFLPSQRAAGMDLLTKFEEVRRLKSGSRPDEVFMLGLVLTTPSTITTS